MELYGGVGCYGKLRCAGDFVTRGLPPGFVARWDGLLQAGMLASRRAFGDAWLPVYLRAPLWRFALGANVLGAQAWIGVLMPSVDSVGRHFPLTIAAPLDAAQPDVLLDRFDAWYDRCGQLALSMLECDANLVLLEVGLMELACMLPHDAAGAMMTTRDESGLCETRPQQGATCGSGASLWCTDGFDGMGRSLRGCLGLPDASQFKGLFDGDTTGWPWCVSQIGRGPVCDPA